METVLNMIRLASEVYKLYCFYKQARDILNTYSYVIGLYNAIFGPKKLEYMDDSYVLVDTPALFAELLSKGHSIHAKPKLLT